MPRRKNRYAGILKPTPIGRGRPEVSVVLVYDIEDDRLRTRVAEACLDYGLERIQYSAFFGRLSRNRRQELALRIAREIEDASARVRMFPICEEDLKEMWSLEQYGRDADVLTKQAEARQRPVLRLVRAVDSHADGSGN